MRFSKATIFALILAFVLALPALADTDSNSPAAKKKKMKKRQPASEAVLPKTPAPEPVPKLYNARLNPFNVFFGRMEADLDVKLADRFTIGPTFGVGWLSIPNASYLGFAFGARANIYLTGDAISSGIFIGPAILYNLWTVSGTATGTATIDGTFGTFIISAVAGYQWVFPSGFNITAGAGAEYAMGPSTYSTSAGLTANAPSQVTGFSPALEISGGYAF